MVIENITKKQLANKRPNIFGNCIYIYFFAIKDLFKKDDV